MASGYGKDSTPNAELLYPRAQHVRCCACSLLRWGLRMYLSVLNIRSSSTDPGTITITNSATLTHSPNRYCAPKRVASPQNSLEHTLVMGRPCCSVLNTQANCVCSLGGWACPMLQWAWNQFFSSTSPSLSQSLHWGCPSWAGSSSH